MDRTNKNIKILTGNLFPAWVLALFFVLVILAIIIVYQTGDFLILAGTILLSSIVWFSKKFFEFNPETKQYREGVCLSRWKHGKWEPLEISNAYIAFQRYNENIHYTYGGLFNQNINDAVFELRLVYPDLTFKKIVNGRDMQSVITMLQLGKILSSLYNVEFRDFVKETVRKNLKK